MDKLNLNKMIGTLRVWATVVTGTDADFLRKTADVLAGLSRDYLALYAVAKEAAVANTPETVAQAQNDLATELRNAELSDSRPL